MRPAWLLLSVLFALAVLPARAQQRPLITEIPEPVGQGKTRLEAGIDFFQNQFYPISGLQGDLVRPGVIGARFGFGPAVEFQIQGVLGNSLRIKQRQAAPFSDRVTATGDSTSDVGDFLFATKIRLRPEGGVWPALALRTGAELPSKSNESGLGVDTNRIFGSVLLGKHLGATYLFSNLGLAIIDRPTVAASQSDKLIYGIAFIHPLNPRVQLAGEIQGMWGNAHPGTEDSSQVRMGAQIRAAGLVWDIAGMAGLQRADPDSGVIFGITRELQLGRAPQGQPRAFRFDPLLFPRGRNARR